MRVSLGIFCFSGPTSAWTYWQKPFEADGIKDSATPDSTTPDSATPDSTTPDSTTPDSWRDDL